MRRCVLIIAALAAVLLTACYRESHHLPTDPAVGDALRLTASAQSIPADGFSRATLTASVSPLTASDKRKVTFKTTAGTLVGAASPGTSLDVDADISGNATAQLRSSTNVETATVTATVAGITHSVQISFTPADPKTIVTISLSTGSAPADGATVVQVYADVASGLPAGSRDVVFTTSFGRFVKSGTATATVTADASNRATADLQVPTTLLPARITAAVGGATAETTLQLVPALPDAINVTVPRSDVKADADVTVSATLRRNLGSVTAGQIVTFSAVDANGATVGTFRDVKSSDSNGVATATYTPDNTSYRGLVTIRASTKSATGAVITDQVTIKVVAPG